MRYQIEFLDTAREDMLALSEKPRRWIARKLGALQDNPRPRGSKLLLGGGEDVRRIRVGEYRVVYRVREENLVVLLVRSGKEKQTPVSRTA